MKSNTNAVINHNRLYSSRRRRRRTNSEHHRQRDPRTDDPKQHGTI
ncbi:MAG UNVERIFIED_CONTAM: hypothetical protein LVT10_00615 [Anaerolineae bacterium]